MELLQGADNMETDAQEENNFELKRTSISIDNYEPVAPKYISSFGDSKTDLLAANPSSSKFLLSKVMH